MRDGRTSNYKRNGGAACAGTMFGKQTLPLERDAGDATKDAKIAGPPKSANAVFKSIAISGVAVKVSRPSQQVLLVTYTRLERFGLLVWSAFAVAFFGFWYSQLLGDIPKDVTLIQHARKILSDEPMLWIFFLLPLLFLVFIFMAVKNAAQGEELAFDGSRQLILKNERSVATFSEVDCVQIRRIHGEGVDYRLTVDLQSGKQIFVDESADSHEITHLADDIADILDKSVVWRGLVEP